MKLLRRLANLGYGSRKEVALMLRNGWVTDAACAVFRHFRVLPQSRVILE